MNLPQTFGEFKLWLLHQIPMFDYFCPSCHNILDKHDRKYSVCSYCGTHIEIPLDKLKAPPSILKNKPLLERYVHRYIMPELKENQYNWLAQWFTTIFSDGFESGTILTTDDPPGAWTSKSVTATYGSLTVQDVIKHHGTYAALSVITSMVGWTNAFCTKTFTAMSPCFARVYFYLDSHTAGACRRIINMGATIGEIVAIGFDATDHLVLRYYDGSVQIDTSATTLSLDTWFYLETQSVIDEVNGEARVYLNGVEVADLTHTGINSGTNGINNIGVGLNNGNSTEAELYFDCVKVADAYVGSDAITGKASSSIASLMTPLVVNRLI